MSMPTAIVVAAVLISASVIGVPLMAVAWALTHHC